MKGMDHYTNKSITVMKEKPPCNALHVGPVQTSNNLMHSTTSVCGSKKGIGSSGSGGGAKVQMPPPPSWPLKSRKNMAAVCGGLYFMLLGLSSPQFLFLDPLLGDRGRRDIKNEEFYIIIDFFHNFSIGNIDNLESVKSMAETNFKMCLIITIQGCHDKEIL